MQSQQEVDQIGYRLLDIGDREKIKYRPGLVAVTPSHVIVVVNNKLVPTAPEEVAWLANYLFAACQSAIYLQRFPKEFLDSVAKELDELSKDFEDQVPKKPLGIATDYGRENILSVLTLPNTLRAYGMTLDILRQDFRAQLSIVKSLSSYVIGGLCRISDKYDSNTGRFHELGYNMKITDFPGEHDDKKVHTVVKGEDQRELHENK